MRSMALGLVLVGCGGEVPHAGSVAVAIASDRVAAARDDEHVIDGVVRFGELEVRDVAISPSPWPPGQPATLALTIAGAGEAVRARIEVLPPRAGSRQVALGGVGAPPETVPDDPRARAIEVELGDGTHAIELPALPDPWHPRRAVVTFAPLRGDTPISATDGPRRSDGNGVLALVPVATAPTTIAAMRATDAVTIDGALHEPVWGSDGTVLVQSLDGEPWDGPPTTMWASWDDVSLYVAARVEDHDVWSDFHDHDDPLWDAEVFEVFVFADDDDEDYLELQLSPRGVTFDARFARHRQADRAWTSRFVTAASVQGTLDDRGDRDEGWTAELAIPWSEICAETSASCPPRAGAELRINAFRFERPRKGRTVGLALSPTRVPDFHAVANAAILRLDE